MVTKRPALLSCFVARGRAGPNLFQNGGFEEVQAISEKEWAPHSAAGWVVAGKPQLPVGWSPGKVRDLHLPGTIEVVSVQASSTADPVVPAHVRTIKERHRNALEKHADRYLGVAVLEWDNDLSYTLLNPQRRAKDKQQTEMMRALGFDPDRPPAKTREEAMGRIENAFQMMNSVYGGHVAFMTSKSIWEHYTLEFGSTVSFSEISNHSNYDPFRFRMAVGRGAAD